MTTSGTSTFDLSLTEIVEEAYERCGAEARSGYDLRTARRSMSLLLLDWANRGLNLWTLEQGTVALVDGDSTYDLPADTVDLLEYYIRTGSGSTQVDLAINRISASTYAAIPSKNSEGRPIQVLIERRSGANYTSGGVAYPRVTFWPIPDASSTYTFVYWRLRRIQDPGNGIVTQDIPFRFLPCLIAGLAYYLAQKIPGAIDRMGMLKAEYDEHWQRAADEDRERASVRFVPRIAPI